MKAHGQGYCSDFHRMTHWAQELLDDETALLSGANQRTGQKKHNSLPVFPSLCVLLYIYKKELDRNAHILTHIHTYCKYCI